MRQAERATGQVRRRAGGLTRDVSKKKKVELINYLPEKFDCVHRHFIKSAANPRRN